MAIEDQLRHPEWLKAQNELLEAKEAFRRDEATKADVDKAQEVYDSISVEIGAA